MEQRCSIIAEAGVNHNGSLDLALRLVDAAKAAGADIVKFQTFEPEKLVSRSAAKAPYQTAATGTDEPQFAMLQKLTLPREAFHALAAHCAERGIGFLSTPFDIESARFLASLGVSAFKVSSGDLTDLPLLRALAGMKRPLILSTGMAALGEVEAALDAVEQAGMPATQVTLLHCTSSYPTPPEEVNLRAMLTMGAAFPRVAVGYSDHTVGIDIPIAAVALGATVLEKHFTLDRSMAGPDHGASLEPQELTAMVSAVRRVMLALGDGRKRPMPSELETRRAVRKSIVAARPIRRGEILSPENLLVLRAGGGLSPFHWDDVVGRPASRDYLAGEAIALVPG